MVPDWLRLAPEAVGWYRRPPGGEVNADWPAWLPISVIDTLRRAGIERPWRHQVQTADHAVAGRHVAVTTPTASGKTLAYALPLLAAHASRAASPGDVPRRLLRAPRVTSLYLAPTKALLHDQRRALGELSGADVPIGTLDGDSSEAERRFARDHAAIVFSNPDMVHLSVLPSHARWAQFLAGLRYVVIDEAHRHHGAFGAHVSAVVRRLRRVCASYGANPTFIAASATSPNASEFVGALIGEPRVEVVDESTAPRAGLEVALWQPSTSASIDAARLLAGLVDDGLQTIGFVASRSMAELTATRAREQIGGAGTIVSYRAGHLAGDRREVEAGLRTGAIRGVAATNALELGVDISGMDAVVVTGFPGTTSAMWQQFGRAGRSGRDALAVLVARDDPLDAWLFAHPEALFGAGLETTVLHTANPYVLGPHLAAAAQELPLEHADARWFGGTMAMLADHLVDQGLLRRRPAGWYWTRPDRAVDFIDIRGIGGAPIDVIEQSTGRVIGTIDRAAADRTVHEGAVYLHQTEQYLVVDYRPDDGHAMAVAQDARWYTQPVSTFDISIDRVTDERPLGRGRLAHGDVTITSQVTGYLRRDGETHAVWDLTPLDLSVRTMATRATWWVVPADVVKDMGLSAVRLGAAMHGMEHCAIGLLPAFAPCDRWDIGGVSSAVHPQTGDATVFVHDGLPGGSGYADRGYSVAEAWLAATAERLATCTCEAGCPSCVVSPKCGNANQSIDRFAARDLLAALLGRRAVDEDP